CILLAVILIVPGGSWNCLKRFIIAIKNSIRGKRVERAEQKKETKPKKKQKQGEKLEAEVIPAVVEIKKAVKTTEPHSKEAHLQEAIKLLDRAPEIKTDKAIKDENLKRAQIIEQALASYGVDAKVVQINPGPVITQFGIEPGWDIKYRKIVERTPEGKIKRERTGNAVEYYEEMSRTRVKVDRITSLSNDLALALAVSSIRIEAPVPGKPLVGIEVPNQFKSTVTLRDSIESATFKEARTKAKLAIALGQSAGGEVVVMDMAQMPHLLIAGSTGSGKTVCLSAIISCLLVNTLPSEVRLLLIDPKRVELVAFNHVPHLMKPVVVEVDEAISTLRRVTWEMDNRYRKFATAAVNNIISYNEKVPPAGHMPYLVVIIDELADLMTASADMVEPAICRIAQLARATGIHIIVATQRPSVDVITGLIKANFPSRISFALPSQIDSRIILDSPGAEKLIGGGDMLYLPIGSEKPKRLRGVFVSDTEVKRLVEFWKQYRMETADNVAGTFATLQPPEGESEVEPLFNEAKKLAEDHKHISASFLQRKLHIGYPRAARLMDLLEEEGFVSDEFKSEAPLYEDDDGAGAA
ncbi:MAG: DNA translocase FtsK, partial [Chloroflexi bacterium]|nr:DNA translocase FtsK [Chloroflexota bacterium]